MSYSPGDELAEGVISSCCGAGVIYPDRCNQCYENCSGVPDLEALEEEVEAENLEAERKWNSE